MRRLLLSLDSRLRGNDERGDGNDEREDGKVEEENIPDPLMLSLSKHLAQGWRPSTGSGRAGLGVN